MNSYLYFQMSGPQIHSVNIMLRIHNIYTTGELKTMTGNGFKLIKLTDFNCKMYLYVCGLILTFSIVYLNILTTNIVHKYVPNLHSVTWYNVLVC